jgi:hypothetical protein
MAAEAAVFIVGWVRRMATINRRIVVAAFLIYNLDAMPANRLFRATRRGCLCPTPRS